ncbi:F-box protein CPR1-like [Neltuma alba]|uniref:F-box protein CPR1-like n=1 Tax=Neltuma alba TaxID=207710 RepID=UPI0010A4FC96|nr:F-box protein CPR1-like [Prosopis alba]XP_028805235.1 F-box protein CPR1-like [Prosopis alba]
MAQNLDRLKDVVPDILSRLPVKSLRRLACVNKSWYRLIKSPDFISKHLHTFNNHMKLTDPINLLVKRTRRATFGPSGVDRKAFVSLLSFNRANSSTILNLLDLIYNHDEVNHIEILGPCNGLYCLYSIPIMIVNPSMREFRILPDSPAPPDTYSLQRHNGFGFDPKTNDYKVVVIMDTWLNETDEQLPWRIEIYSLNSHCWRNVDCLLPPVSIWNCSWIDAFVHGAFHWWAYDAAGDLVLAFDMVNETFQTFRVPNARPSSREYVGTVAKFRDSLAVIVYPRRGTEKCFDLWVMEDYGNEGSWTKHSIIGPIVGAGRPLGFLEEKNLFLLEDNNGRMVFYDLQTEEIMHTGFHGEEDSLQAVVYMESLISVRGDNENPQAGASFFGMIPDPLFEGNSG